MIYAYVLIVDKGMPHSLSDVEILRLESKGVRTTIFTKTKKELLCSRHLKAVCMQLDPRIFIRIHKSHVVNIREVVRYENGKASTVVLSDGTQLPVAKRKKAFFLKRFSAQ